MCSWWEQGPQPEIVVKCFEAQVQRVVGAHPIGAGAHRLQGEIRLLLELPRQDGRHRLGQHGGHS